MNRPIKKINLKKPLDRPVIALPKFGKTKRKISHKGLVKKLDTLFSKFIRQRDSLKKEPWDKTNVCKCCTCGKINLDVEKRVHAGHFQKRDNWNTRYDERNVHAQCHQCNTFKGGRDFEFGLYIDKKYGPGTAESLYIKAKLPRKWYRVELEEMIKIYQNKLKETR